MNKIKVYTAGGFHGDWRQRFNDTLGKAFIILDPFDKEFDSVKKERKRLSFPEYTAWDKWAIRTADVVFVYSERTNPGQGYIAELGYAAGLGKTVVLVRELENQHMPDRYLEFMECMADFVCYDFDTGIEFMSRLSF